jgi:hypothetical protein
MTVYILMLYQVHIGGTINNLVFDARIEFVTEDANLLERWIITRNSHYIVR